MDQGPEATDRYWYDTGELSDDGYWCGVECLFKCARLWIALPELPNKDEDDGRAEVGERIFIGQLEISDVPPLINVKDWDVTVEVVE